MVYPALYKTGPAGVGNRQAGVALLTVMFILVLMSSLLVYTIEDEHLSIRRISNQRDAEQGYQMATGAEQWAMIVLRRDAQQTEIDHLAEAWNNLLPQVGVEEGKLSSRVEDLQGRFNINNLGAGRDEIWYPAFQRLLRVLELEEGLADAVVDWVDPDQETSGSFGAEDAEYLSLQPSYRSANRPFSEVGELIWVKGFDADKVAALQPYLSALPAGNVRINVNTAPNAILRILARDLIAERDAQALAEGRGSEGYESADEFLAAPQLAGQGNTATPLVTVASNFFQVESRAEFGR